MLEQLKYIIVPVLALIMAQLIKFIIESIKAKKLKWGRLLNGCGGMPSSHTTFVFSLTTMIFLNVGYESPVFAIALIFSLIVAYDSFGLRKESGNQAVMINRLIDEMIEEDTKAGYRKLKEQLGHNPSEVVAGILFGSIFALVFNYFLC